MKIFIIHLFAACAIMSSRLDAATVKPVAVDLKGNVTADKTQIQPKDSVLVGAEIGTGGSGRALFSLVPGMTMVVKEKSSVRIVAAESASHNRYAEVALLDGKVACSLKKQGTQSQRFRLDLGSGCYAEARGTSWEGSSNGKVKQVVITSGVVDCKFPGPPATVALEAGSVLTINFDYVNELWVAVSATILNLIDGTLVTYLPDGTAPTTILATGAQIANGRTLFDEAILQRFDGLDNDERAGLLALLFSINKTLTSSGVAAITPPSAATNNTENRGKRGNVTSNNPSDAVSPIAP